MSESQAPDWGSNEPSRRNITFAQAEGVEPLPQQLRRGEVSPALRAAMWYVIHEHFSTSVSSGGFGALVGAPWNTVIKRWAVAHDHLMIDEVPVFANDVVLYLKGIITHPNTARFYTFVEFLVRSGELPRQFKQNLDDVLRINKSAYRVVEGSVIPISEPNSADAVINTFDLLKGGRFPGSASHLRAAAQHLSSGDWAASVHDSINAIESAARVLAPEAKTLTPALAALEKTGTIHQALRSGFGALYGYTSDQAGIRHALLTDTTADVDEADAMYMFGACAAFLSYLILKSTR